MAAPLKLIVSRKALYIVTALSLTHKPTPLYILLDKRGPLSIGIYIRLEIISFNTPMR
jgi:hypothetical protein